MAIQDICVSGVASISPSDSLVEASRRMKKLNLGALVVTDKANGQCKPKGLITDRDIALSAAKYGKDLNAITVGDIMAKNLVIAKETDGIFEVVRIMRKKKVNRVPIVDSKGFLSGIISSDDILDLVSAELSELASLRTMARKKSSRDKRSQRKTSIPNSQTLNSHI